MESFFGLQYLPVQGNAVYVGIFYSSYAFTTFGVFCLILSFRSGIIFGSYLIFAAILCCILQFIFVGTNYSASYNSFGVTAPMAMLLPLDVLLSNYAFSNFGSWFFLVIPSVLMCFNLIALPIVVYVRLKLLINQVYKLNNETVRDPPNK